MRKIFYSLTILLFASMILIPSSSFGSTPINAMPYKCGINEIPLYYLEYSFDLKKSTVPSGKMAAFVFDICLNKEKQSLSFSILAGHYQYGKMTINIPRDDLNPQNSSCEDDIFQIDRHGKHTAYEETKTDDFREITFPIMSGDTRITIFAENPENTKLCAEKDLKKEYTLEEALEIQRKRLGLPKTNDSSSVENTYPQELTPEIIEEMEEMAKILNLPPLKQFKIYETDNPYDINCKSGLDLIVKKSNGLPACVKPETAEKLIDRGWAAT